MTISQAGSVSVAESGNTLMSAFQAVQKADNLGAPPDQVSVLSTQLNTALANYNTAVELSSKGDITDSEYYSTLSNTESTLVLDKALALQNQAETDRTNQQIMAYSMAIAASIVSSTLILESHRIRNFFRRRRLFGIKLLLGDHGGKQK
jgi:hypothetical protein